VSFSVDYRSKYPAPLRLLSTTLDYFLVFGGLSVLLLIFTNAVLRGAAGFDLAWSLEVTAFLLLWLTFLGCAAATARGAHMRVTEVINHFFSDHYQFVLTFIIDCVVVTVLASLIYFGYSIAAHTWAQKTTVLYWPVGLLYLSLPVGMLVTLVFHSYNMKLDFAENNIFKKPTVTSQPEDSV